MKAKNYKEIDQKYEEGELFGQPVLFTDLRVSRKDLPKGIYAYSLRHGDEDWGEAVEVARNIIVNHYGDILTYKPIDIGSDPYKEIKEGDFYRDGEYYDPSEVDEWIQHQLASDNNSEEVMNFINTFIGFSICCGNDEENIRKIFMRGYCYYFAEMLKAAFDCGEVYICAPYGHVVWRDVDNRFYDFDGEYKNDEVTFVPVTDPDSFIGDFKRLADNEQDKEGATKEDIQHMIEKYSGLFPNK